MSYLVIGLMPTGKDWIRGRFIFGTYDEAHAHMVHDWWTRRQALPGGSRPCVVSSLKLPTHAWHLFDTRAVPIRPRNYRWS